MTPTSFPGWQWLRGMTTTDGRVCLSSSLGVTVWNKYDSANPEPDLDDPATGGAMLALLGDEAWRAVGMYRETVGIGFYSHVAVPFGYRTDYHPTLARACLAVAVSLGRWPGGCK